LGWGALAPQQAVELGESASVTEVEPNLGPPHSARSEVSSLMPAPRFVMLSVVHCATWSLCRGHWFDRVGPKAAGSVTNSSSSNNFAPVDSRILALQSHEAAVSGPQRQNESLVERGKKFERCR
jgi:hypothetical protein